MSRIKSRVCEELQETSRKDDEVLVVRWGVRGGWTRSFGEAADYAV